MGWRGDGDAEGPATRVAVKGGRMVMEQMKTDKPGRDVLDRMGTEKTITDNTDGDVSGRRERKNERMGRRGGAGNGIKKKGSGRLR